MVMVRPLSAAQALSAAMGAQFGAIAEEATAAAQAESAGPDVDECADTCAFTYSTVGAQRRYSK